MTKESAGIETVDDLVTAVNAPSGFETIRAMHSWLPDLIYSLPWKIRMSRRYLLHYHIDAHDKDDVLFDSLVREAETIYDQLERFFHIEARSKQETVALQTRLVFFIIKARTELTFGSMIDPHTLFYLLDSHQDPEYMEKIRHELAHWAWGRVYGEAPSLFWEGLAVYAAKMSKPEADVSASLDRGVSLAEIPPLCEIAINESFWQYKAQGMPMYTIGSLLVRFLVEKWGWDPLKHLFLCSDYEDADVLEHFCQIYDHSLDTVDVEWRQWLKLQPQPDS